MLKPILFLDIDGVLNSNAWARECVGTGRVAFRDMDPTAVGHLRRIVDSTGCAIVISSTWREMHTLEEIGALIASAGWEHKRPMSRPPIIGATPVLPGPLRLGARDTIRGREVEIWRATAAHSGPYVCLDDNEWFLPDQPLVLTDFEDGLTHEHAERAIAILRGERRQVA